MKKNYEKKGICKLTGTRGNFVNSHIIPRALTKLNQNGEAIVQYGEDQRPKRRLNSWFDPELVTQEGEDILKDLDTWAIRELRRQKLVWSGWGNLVNIDGVHEKIDGTPYGIRKIEICKKEKFRRFFMSILWRSASTSLPEFSEIQIQEDDLKKMGNFVCEKETTDISFYPSMLLQLSTIGIPHNHTPIATTKELALENKKIDMPIFRFYFDGLMVHYHRHASDDGTTDKLGNMVVGAKKEIIVPTIKYEASFQNENTKKLMLSYNNRIAGKSNA